jgi:hypothetical protein
MTVNHPYLPDVAIRNSTGRKVATLRRRTLDDMRGALDWAIAQRDDGQSYNSVSNGSSFSGTSTGEEYRDMLRDGWAKGVEGVEGLDGLTSDRHERLAFNRNVAGVFPVVPAYLAGSPNCMLECRPMPTDAVRAVTLVVDGSFNCGVKSKTALDYAQQVMRMVAWLQAEQIDTTVHVVVPVTMHNKRTVYITEIRRSGDVLQPERIAVALHPSWLRRAWFAMCEREYHEYGVKECRVCLGGYGRSEHVTADELRTALPDAQSIIMLPKVGDGNPENAIRDALNMKLQTE